MGTLTPASNVAPPSKIVDASDVACVDGSHRAGRSAVVRTLDIDGVQWTAPADFCETLARVPAAAWIEPASQPDWKRIKRSAVREVWRVRVGDVICYAKYYAAHGLRERFRRLMRGSPCENEWNTGLYAAGAGIPASRPVGYVRRLPDTQRRALLLTEAIEPAVTLSEQWRMIAAEPHGPDRREATNRLVESLADMIARAHQAGFEHVDMHAANILVRERRDSVRTFLIDLHSARLGTPVSDAAVVRNLVQLNQWFRRHGSVKDRLRFLRAYVRRRNDYEHEYEHGRALEMTFPQFVQALVEAAGEHADRLWSRRDRRAGRSGRYFERIRVAGWRGMVTVRCKHVLDESPASALVFDPKWWRTQLANPLRLLDAEGDACKRSHSALVARADLELANGEMLPVIVKRPLARNWRRALRQALPPSRCARGWQTGHALLNRNVPAARPLAVLERRLGPFVLDSLLLTERLADAADLEQHLRREYERTTPREWRAHKRVLIERLARQLRVLEDRGFEHRDCKAQNLLVIGRREPELVWIDMDGVRYASGPLSRERRLRPLLRLHVSLLDVPGLTRGDRVRFLRRYLARFGANSGEWRDVWRELAGPVAAKLTQRDERRAWKREHYGRE